MLTIASNEPNYNKTDKQRIVKYVSLWSNPNIKRRNSWNLLQSFNEINFVENGLVKKNPAKYIGLLIFNFSYPFTYGQPYSPLFF